MRTKLAKLPGQLGVASTISAILLLASPAPAAETNLAHHLQYEPDIRAFEAADITNPPPKDAVLFIGSSSIRKWTNAPAQFPGHKIINRGFGGSYLSDSVAFAERILIPYRPKLVVLYAGDNDIAGGRTPEEVFGAFKAFVAQVRKGSPQTTTAFISIKPSPSREKFLRQNQAANRLIREFIGTDPRLIYLDVFTPMQTAGGHTRGELFQSDRLHLNEAGYKLWAGIVKPVLDKVDPPTQP
jgi:lysophospholipase L1-like esterase